MVPANTLQKKKIIFLVMTSGLGGAERQALYYSEHLIRNHQCTVEWWNMSAFDGDLANALGSLKIKKRRILYPGSKNAFKLNFKLFLFSRILRKAKPDVIFPYLLNPNVYANLMWQKTGAKACFWNQRDEGILTFDYDPAFIRKAIDQTCCLITNSEGGKNYLLKQGAAVDKVHIIKNGIHVYHSSEKSRQKLAITSGFDYVCTMVANIHPNKDHKTLIKAWKIVVEEFAKKNKRPLLILLGKQFEHYHDAHDQIYENGLMEYILRPGFTTDVFPYLENSDLYVHSSISEGTSNSILEAMMASKAIVATSIPSIIKTVSEINKPFLSAPRDEKALAAHIIHLLENPELRSQIGASNRVKAISEFSMENMCDQTDKLISRFLG